MPDITISSILAMIAVNWGVPAVLVFWYAGRVRHPARPRWRAFLMAMAVVAVVPPAWLAALYYYVVIHDGSMVLAVPAILALPFVLRALIRGWLRRPPAVRRAPERSPSPAQAWDALATHAAQQTDQGRQFTGPGVSPGPSASLSAELSIGTSAGSELYHRMLNARESVLVVSPFLDEHLVDCLLKLHGRGVGVDLVTMEDFAPSQVRKHKIAQTLVSQTPSRDEAAVTRRRRGMLWSALGGIGAAGMAIGLNGVSPWAPLGWYLLPVAAIVFAIYWRRGIYRYTYAWTLRDTKILPSHYRSHTDCPYVHVKLYVIDREVAFLGSLNFTKPGLFDNFETCLRVDKRDDVRALELLIKSQLKEIESWSLAPSDVGAWLVNARVWHKRRAVG